MAAVQPPPPDVREIEEELLGRRRGPSAGEVVFSLLFGAVAPLLMLWADPGLFLPIHDVPGAPEPVLAPYWAAVCWAGAGVIAVLLTVWLLTGARRPVLGLLVVGPFAAGFVLSLVLAVHLVWIALGFGAHAKGILAFTPWLTAFVLARQGLRALHAAADLSRGLAAVTLVVGTAVLLGVFAAAVGARRSLARRLEDQLFSRDLPDHTYALDQMLHTRAYDPGEIVVRYSHLGPRDPRRQRIATAYESLSRGETMQAALIRLGLVDRPPPPVPAPATATPPATAVAP
ncbi:MAG: hypothetical protein ACODAJ_04180 [Planctomycetota bacterium]